MTLIHMECFNLHPRNGPGMDQGANAPDVAVNGSTADSLACVHCPLSMGAARGKRGLINGLFPDWVWVGKTATERSEMDRAS